jgi:micrococcal nuclease
MRRTSSILLLLVALVVVAAVAPARAAAATGPCLLAPAAAAGGPVCTIWKGKVTFVADGDTIDVDLAGDGTKRARRIRITGLQAMEQTAYSSRARRRRGACHALAATARLEGLIRRARGVVRLAAQDPASRSGARLRRSVAVRIGGRWRDVGRTLMAEGHALWLPNPVEHAWNDEYSALGELAAGASRGIWDTDRCAAGPSQPVALRLIVNWDADGDDSTNVNGEWIRIENADPVHGVSLGGWWVRDSALRRFTFPSWAQVGPGEAVTVHVGAGPNAGTEFHWGLSAPAFENTDGAPGIGDGAYLFDPDGDLRAWMTYPCRLGCTDD